MLHGDQSEIRKPKASLCHLQGAFMPFLARRVWSAYAMSLGVLAAGAYPGTPLAAPATEPRATAGQPARGVIVMLRNQHTDLSITRGATSPRVAAARKDQAPVIATAKRFGVRDIRGFRTVNAFAAT